MKKLDFRSVLIGFLMAVIFFLLTGQSTNKSGFYDTLTVANLKVTGMTGVTGPNGKLQISLSSDEKGGAIGIYDINGKLQMSLSSGVSGGAMHLLNKQAKVIATIQSSKEDDGVIILLDKDGKPGWAVSGNQ